MPEFLFLHAQKSFFSIPMPVKRARQQSRGVGQEMKEPRDAE